MSRQLAARDYRFTVFAYVALFFGAFIVAAVSGAAGFGGALFLIGEKQAKLRRHAGFKNGQLDEPVAGTQEQIAARSLPS